MLTPGGGDVGGGRPPLGTKKEGLMLKRQGATPKRGAKWGWDGKTRGGGGG